MATSTNVITSYSIHYTKLYDLRGRALMQVSTASVEQINLSTAFSGGQSRGGRRSFSLEGVPPMAQGLSLLSPPPPVKRVITSYSIHYTKLYEAAFPVFLPTAPPI